MKSSRVFKEIFLGEYVEILIKMADNENSPVMQVTGYFLDLDNDHYFIGQQPDAVSQCIPKKDVGFINIITPDNPATDLLKKLPNMRREDGN